MPDLIVNRSYDGLGAAELKNFNAHRLATAPATNLIGGRFYFDTATNKFMYYTGSGWRAMMDGTVTSVNLTAPAAGITVSGGPITDAGSITMALADDLLALESLGSTGFAVRTAANTWAQRTLTGTTNQVSVANGDGVGGNPTFSLPQNIHTGATPTFANVSITAMGTAATDAATKGYVDNAVQGLKWKQSVVTATTANITLSGTQTIEGRAVIAGERVLVKAQTNTQDNGIYIVAAGAWTRATDADTWDELVSATVMVQEGNLADTQWTCSANPGGTLGTTALPWAQLGGGTAMTAGAGLSLTGNDLAVNVDGSTIEINSDALRVKDAGITLAKMAASASDPIAGTAGLRSLGTGAQQAAAGNHNHDSVYAKKPVVATFGASATENVTHNLGTLNTRCYVRLTNSPYTQVDVDYVPTSINAGTITLLSAPGAGLYTYIISGE